MNKNLGRILRCGIPAAGFLAACGGGTFEPSGSSSTTSSSSSSSGSSGAPSSSSGSSSGGAAAPPSAATYSIGGTVSGLAGSGLVLQDAAGHEIAVTANGTFAFADKAVSGESYAITVKSQPAGPEQTCVVSGGTGVVATGNVTSIAVNCDTNRFTIGGTVTGLTGAGLTLQNSAGDDLIVSANGTFAFGTTVPDGAPYAVTVASDPTNPSQTCVVSAGSGTVSAGNVSTVAITCTTNTYQVGGNVTGLQGSGLKVENGDEELALDANGSFVFLGKVASNATFAVTVVSQPTGPQQTCEVSGATGTVVSSDVTTVSVDCTTDAYTVSGTATGLAGGKAVLQNNGGDDIEVTANGGFAFDVPIANGSPYEVKVKTDPTGPTQTCTLANASGTMGLANVTNVELSCVTTPFKIKATVEGLDGTGLVLQNSAGDDLPVTANGTFEFATPVLSGASYQVTVLHNPAGKTQTCLVTENGTGNVGGADVIARVVCTTASFPVNVTVTGLTTGPLVLQNNGGDALSFAASATAPFAAPVASGAQYAVTVLSDPSATCKVQSGSGTVTTGPVSVVVRCGCGNGELESGEEVDPPPGPFASAPVSSSTCRFDFSNVKQLYCNGSCSYAGAAGCDQADADLFCQLRTGNAASVASSFQIQTALAEPGFSCLGPSVGPFPSRGVNRTVRYQDSSVLATHGSGAVIVNPVCTNP